MRSVDFTNVGHCILPSTAGCVTDVGQIRTQIGLMCRTDPWIMCTAPSKCTGFDERQFAASHRLLPRVGVIQPLHLGVTGVPLVRKMLWCRVLCQIGGDENGLLGVNIVFCKQVTLHPSEVAPCVMRKKGKGGKWKRQTDAIMNSASFEIARFPFSPFPLFPFLHLASDG